jgi:hypothetical protein
LELYNPGSLSAGILWGDSNDIQENLTNYMNEFNIKRNGFLMDYNTKQ